MVRQVCLQNAASGEIQELMKCESEDNYVNSVRFPHLVAT